jgi:hypothetical protein
MMRMAIIFLAAAVIAVPAVTLAATTAKHSKPQVQAVQVTIAPADEYFGPTKMSVLGIRNTIQDTQIRASGDPDHMTAHYWGALSLTNSALSDWATKYPHDTWIPRNAFLLSRLFDRMHTAEGDAAATACRQLLFKNFATTWYAREAQHDLEIAGKPATQQ